MTAEPVSDLQRRFFDAALDLLAEEGYGRLKQTHLVKRMGLTTGAFFHSFAGWKDFTDRLLEHWHSERTLRVSEAVRAEPDAARQVESLLVSALGLAHASESAIRAWGGADPDVQRLVDQVDAERLAVVTDAFTALSGDPSRSARLATTALYVLVGYEQAASVRDPATLEWALRMLQASAVAPS